MPINSPIIASLNGGEFSPLLGGRVDFEKYPKSLQLCENFMPLIQGPLMRRPGTYYVAAVKDSSKRTALVRFEFSTTQAYVIEFGDQYMRFYKDEGQILNLGVPYEVSTPYVQADLFDSNGALKLKFAQSADTLYVAHPSYAPRKITRTGHTSWTISTISFKDGPYLTTNATTTTMTPSGTTGAITITASAATFAATDVGRIIRIKHANKWGWATITGYTSTTVVNATTGADFGATTAQTDWRLGVWGGTNGYPAAVTFYGDRLYWGGCTGYPQRIDGSNVGDYENMAPTSFAAGSTTDNTVIADDDAIALGLGGDEVNAIKSILGSEQGIVVLTVGGEWIVRPSNQNEALTPTNARATQSTNWGVAEPAPVRAGRATMFIQRDRHTLRELSYVFADDGFKAPDMSVIAEHIMRPGVCAMAFMRAPQTIIWMVREDGTLVACTYDRDQEVVAWSRHILGGSYNGANAVVESIAVIPNTTGTADQLWMIVKRTINGATKRYVEFMKPFWDASMVKADAFFVDCGLTYSGVAASSFSGLSHLEGQTVDILADGSARPQQAVSAGAVTLTRGTATKAHIGLPCAAKFWTEQLEIRVSGSTSQTRPKRITEVSFRVWQTLGGKVGPDADNLDYINFRSSSDPMDTSPPLYDGDKKISFAGRYDSEGTVYFLMDQPLPATVLAIVPTLWVDA